jgi:glycosyltransferase involved in cell wall biosynthesis
MSLLSIITVNLNNKLGLEKTLSSLAIQKKKKTKVELIVIDGGSKDGSIDIIKKYSKIVDYYVSEKDVNLYDAMNKGIKYSKNKYIIFINSGDNLLFKKNILKKILLRLAKPTNYVFRFTVSGYGYVWRSSPKRICHEAVVFLNKKKIFYDITKNPFADGYYINENFKKYGKKFENLFILNFNLGGISNNFLKYSLKLSFFNQIKFLFYKITGAKMYHSISYWLKNYKKNEK